MKMQIIYKPEGAPQRDWVVDRDNPSWDIAYATEKATDWAWLQFLNRVDSMSAIAWQALLWVLRKRDEPRLRLDWVEIEWSEIDLRIECPNPRCGEWISAQGDHECEVPAPDDEPGPEDEAPKKTKKKAGESDPEA